MKFNLNFNNNNINIINKKTQKIIAITYPLKEQAH